MLCGLCGSGGTRNYPAEPFEKACTPQRVEAGSIVAWSVDIPVDAGASNKRAASRPPFCCLRELPQAAARNGETPGACFVLCLAAVDAGTGRCPLLCLPT